MFKTHFAGVVVTAEYIIRWLAQQLCDGCRSRSEGRKNPFDIKALSGFGRRLGAAATCRGSVAPARPEAMSPPVLAHDLLLATCAIAARRDHLSGIRPTIIRVRPAFGRRSFAFGRQHVCHGLREKTTPAPRCLSGKKQAKLEAAGSVAGRIQENRRPPENPVEESLGIGEQAGRSGSKIEGIF